VVTGATVDVTNDVAEPEPVCTLAGLISLYTVDAAQPGRQLKFIANGMPKGEVWKIVMVAQDRPSPLDARQSCLRPQLAILATTLTISRLCRRKMQCYPCILL
jgi:hypothetical protein